MNSQNQHTPVAVYGLAAFGPLWGVICWLGIPYVFPTTQINPITWDDSQFFILGAAVSVCVSCSICSTLAFFSSLARIQNHREKLRIYRYVTAVALLAGTGLSVTGAWMSIEWVFSHYPRCPYNSSLQRYPCVRDGDCCSGDTCVHATFSTYDYCLPQSQHQPPFTSLVIEVICLCMIQLLLALCYAMLCKPFVYTQNCSCSRLWKRTNGPQLESSSKPMSPTPGFTPHYSPYLASRPQRPASPKLLYRRLSDDN